ncbi:uncharacterized protein LOC125663877 [Ostrea edulis]|uniref:uncharacterized protein LOC125663877 n=1 Tax=Ostrea edulis TaxID=37623 RepID=UPI0020951659|nr:uncharacterized protein LOC125663877 [Ostrea edulis]
MAMDTDTLIHFYFLIGLTYNEIVSCLALQHQVLLSERTLKRRLAAMNLYRRKNKPSLIRVSAFLSKLILKDDMQSGYRWMHQRCLLAGYMLSRETVAGLLSIPDPEGVELRKRKRLFRREYYAKGPNYLWHVDSYDKLKNYGICMNGCIDGYSRKIIWCEVTHSSSDPRIVAGHLILSVEKISACPRKVRGDRGTENKDIAEMQSILTTNGTFIYGSSTGNQRIEAFWRLLRMECCQFWIEFFGHLRDLGEFSGDIIYKNLVQLVFMNFVQNDIDEAESVWNTHRIRPTKNGNVPAGKPCILYCIPELEGTKNYSLQVDQHVLQICRNECLFHKNTPNDSDMHEFIKLLMEENTLTSPETVEEAYDLYVTLHHMANREIHIF